MKKTGWSLRFRLSSLKNQKKNNWSKNRKDPGFPRVFKPLGVFWLFKRWFGFGEELFKGGSVGFSLVVLVMVVLGLEDVGPVGLALLVSL